MLPPYVIGCTARDMYTWRYITFVSGKKISLRCQCTCPETKSREGSPVRGEGSSAGRGEGLSAGRGERSSASESGEQLAQLLEEVGRLREGQEDAACIEDGERRSP